MAKDRSGELDDTPRNRRRFKRFISNSPTWILEEVYLPANAGDGTTACKWKVPLIEAELEARKLEKMAQG